MNIEAKIVPATIKHDIAFDPLVFFDGHIEAKGFVLRRNNDVARTFIANFDGKASGDHIEIHEVLTYNDGEIDRRFWHMEKKAHGLWYAIAEGLVDRCVIKSGHHPQESRWTYQMDLLVGKRKVRFDMQDIMVLLTETEMVSLTPMKKFGVTLARISCHYRKLN